MLENAYKQRLIQTLYFLYPTSIITHMDPCEIQGIPDILILYNNRWATLEGKKSSEESFRPNQLYYIDLMNKMSFSRAIYPENEKEVLNDLHNFFIKEDSNDIQQAL